VAVQSRPCARSRTAASPSPLLPAGASTLAHDYANARTSAATNPSRAVTTRTSPASASIASATSAQAAPAVAVPFHLLPAHPFVTPALGPASAPRLRSSVRFTRPHHTKPPTSRSRRSSDSERLWSARLARKCARHPCTHQPPSSAIKRVI
jgi:hypothetical protein